MKTAYQLRSAWVISFREMSTEESVQIMQTKSVTAEVNALTMVNELLRKRNRNLRACCVALYLAFIAALVAWITK